MDGRAVRALTVPCMARALREALADAALQPSQLARLLAHQTSHRILLDLAADLGLPPEKMASNLRQLGNTSSCTLPLLLRDLQASSALHPGEHIGLTAFGGGFTYGAAVARVI